MTLEVKLNEFRFKFPFGISTLEKEKADGQENEWECYLGCKLVCFSFGGDPTVPRDGNCEAEGDDDNVEASAIGFVLWLRVAWRHLKNEIENEDGNHSETNLITDGMIRMVASVSTNYYHRKDHNSNSNKINS